jgi:hypothetical protein
MVPAWKNQRLASPPKKKNRCRATIIPWQIWDRVGRGVYQHLRIGIVRVHVWGPHSWYSFCRQIAWIGMPGIMFTAVFTIALQIGLPLGGVLLIATPVNFFLYLGIGLALRRLVTFAN